MSRARALPLSADLFAVFSDVIEQACGVHYGIRDRAILETKLEAQALDLGYDSLLDFYYRLRYDDASGAELTRLVETILVHETYFFRELAPLTQLVDGHLAKVIKAKGRARVWSAACSTGEEPYTLAILLAERGLLDKVEIVASDVSAKAIERARIGCHGVRALRDGHPAEIAARYLEVSNKSIAVAPRIREAVTFSQVNLLEDAAVRELGAFDAIVCRNVLIYFRDEQIVRLIERLARSLTPDGLIAVGVSESLLRFGTSLVCEEYGHSFFYRAER